MVASQPVAVVGHPNPLSQLESNDPDLAANKRLAFDMFRIKDGRLAEHWDASAKPASAAR